MNCYKCVSEHNQGNIKCLTNINIVIITLFAEICLRRVHNRIHNIQKPKEALPGQVLLLKVIEEQRTGKGDILLLDQTTNFSQGANM